MQKWQTGLVLSESWEGFKKHMGPLLGGVVIVYLVSMAFSFVAEFAMTAVRMGGINSDHQTELAFVGMAISWFVQLIAYMVNAYLALGLTQIYLKAARDEDPTIGDLFSGGPVYLSGLASLFLFSLAIGFGTLLCIVPGIIAFLGLQFHHLIIVDKRVGCMEALSESWRLADGDKMDLFVWALVCFGLSLAGMAACCIGLFVAMPVCGLGTTLIYLNLDSHK